MDVSVTHGRLGAAAADFINKPRHLLIDNEWVEAKSGKRFAVFDPATSQQITEVAEAEAAGVDLAVAAARRAFETGAWASMKPSARGQLLWRLADLMEAHADGLAEIESLDNGKPGPSPAPATSRSPSTCSATWPASPPRCTARR